MLIHYTHYPTGHNCSHHFSHTFPKKKNPQIIIDYFKGLLMTHYLDIFMFVKNLGLNGLRPKRSNVLLGLGTRSCLLARQHWNVVFTTAAHPLLESLIPPHPKGVLLD